MKIKARVLDYGKQVQILELAAMREKVLEKARKMLEMHQKISLL